MSEPCMTLTEVRQRLHVSRATLWRWTVERGLKVVRVGGVVRIRESDLQAFLARHESVETAGKLPDRAENGVARLS